MLGNGHVLIKAKAYNEGMNWARKTHGEGILHDAIMQRHGQFYHEKVMLCLMIHLEENVHQNTEHLALFMIASCIKQECQVYGRVGEIIFQMHI